MKTIDEAIFFYQEKIRICAEYAKECEICANRKIEKFLRLDKIRSRDIAKCKEEIEHCEQIIGWLRELKEYKNK